MVFKRLAIGVALAATVVGTAQAQTVRAGIEAWQSADYAKAVSIWRPLAENGDADAQFNLAQAYRLGRGVALNLGVAKTWFERAAKTDHLDAQTTLGLLLFQNGDQAEALRWLGKAAEKGEPRAMLVYGTALVNGDTVTQNPVLGYAYVSRAAAQNLGPAKDTLKQLDEILTLDERKKGLALAKAKAKAAPPPTTTTARAAADAKPKPKPTPAAPKANGTATAALPPAKPVAGGNWRIQLGAFGQKSSAQSLFGKVSGTLPGRQAYYIPVGAVTRLQVGPFATKSEANAACARLKGQACFPVAAK